MSQQNPRCVTASSCLVRKMECCDRNDKDELLADDGGTETVS